jgi:hypothetical protein
MLNLNLKVINVNETTSENGKTVTVALGYVANSEQQGPGHAMPGMSFGINVSDKPDEVEFFKANVGHVVVVPLDINTVTVIQ